MAKENENFNQENNELKNDYDKEIKEKDDITNQLDNYKMMNYQLQKTLDDYSTELNNKINDLNNIAYDKNEIENKNIKLTNDKLFLLNILLKITKLFSLSNIDEIINNLFNKGKIRNNENDINQKLIEELQRCQEYINMLKDNDLEIHLLYMKINEDIQAINKRTDKYDKDDSNNIN